jgi:hypothetical protein
MVGMLQIITYLLCVYLVFKGIEIYQIAKMSTSEDRSAGLRLGKTMIVVSVIAAAVFYVLIDLQAEKISSNVPRLP